MKLSEIKEVLKTVDVVNFQLPNGTFVPQHFHITEVGLITKNFIDCGGTVRIEKVLNFQLWDANDFDHKLKPQKLLNIIALSERIFGTEDLEIEVEYQDITIGKYDLYYNGQNFHLLNKKTACLALNQCGIPPEKQKIKLTNKNNNPSCAPSGKCC